MVTEKFRRQPIKQLFDKYRKLLEKRPARNRQHNHQKGCGTVTEVIKEKFADAFALGIIDKDKKEVDYLKEFTVLTSKGALILHKHKIRHHYIIQVTPAMETFMFSTAHAVNLTLADYELPTELKELTKTAKSTTRKDDRRFKKLFRALLAAGAEDLVRLKNWVTYLKTHNYQADIQELLEF